MALSTQDALKVKRKAFSAVRTLGLSSAVSQSLNSLFQEVSQKYGNPNLQFVDMVAASTTDAVVADVACKLYGVFFKGGATARDIRWADHATDASSPSTTIAVGVSEQGAYVYPGGKAFTTGLTFDQSGASGPNGFFIIGPA
jgi:hypothetical protein